MNEFWSVVCLQQAVQFFIMFAPSGINEIRSDPWTVPVLSLSKFQKLISDLIKDITEPLNFLSSLGMGTDTTLKITVMLC